MVVDIEGHYLCTDCSGHLADCDCDEHEDFVFQCRCVR